MTARLAEIVPGAILHAGDVGDPTILDALAELAPVYAVRGNIDGHERDLPDVLLLDVAAPVPSRILMTHIALYGPKLRAEVARTAKVEGARLVVCGHSHVPFIGSDKGVTVFNPGSIGPRRFTADPARHDRRFDGRVQARAHRCSDRPNVAAAIA